MSQRIPLRLNVRSFAKSSANAGVPIAAVAGFIADIASPVFAFPKLFLGLALFACVFLTIYWFRWKRPEIIAAYAADGISADAVRQHLGESKWFKAFAVSIAAVFVFSGFNVAAALTQEGDEGFLAATFAGVAKLQEQMFQLQADVTDIKKTTDTIASDTKAIIAKLDDISKQFAALPEKGIVASPSTPQDFYHNAKVYELEANFSQARQAYARYLEFNLPFVDPHLSYQRLLRVQDGLEGAREIYEFLARSAPSNQAVLFAKVLLLDGERRRAALTQFAIDHPDFGPTQYWLSLEFGEDKVGVQTVSDKENEREALVAFMAAVDGGKVLKFFIDKNVGLEAIEDAKARLAKAEAMQVEMPVSLYYNVNVNSASINVVLTDAAREMWYRFGDQGDFVSSGKATWIDPRLGAFGANLALTTKPLASDINVWIKYRAQNDDIVGPFKVVLSPQKFVIERTQQVFAANPEWVGLRRSDGTVVANFGTLLAQKPAIKAIQYSVNAPSLDRMLKFVPQAITESGHMDKSDPWTMDLPSDTTKIYVQVTFKDGSKSVVNVSHIKESD